MAHDLNGKYNDLGTFNPSLDLCNLTENCVVPEAKQNVRRLRVTGHEMAILFCLPSFRLASWRPTPGEIQLLVVFLIHLLLAIFSQALLFLATQGTWKIPSSYLDDIAISIFSSLFLFIVAPLSFLRQSIVFFLSPLLWTGVSVALAGWLLVVYGPAWALTLRL